MTKQYNKEKTLFRSYYCAGCRQQKPCQPLTGWDSKWESYCCECYFQSEQIRAEEYSDYQTVYKREVKKQKGRIQQLQMLRTYTGCLQCGSLEVDAYELYENNQSVCQPCLVLKTGESSSPISFLEQKKWYSKRWGVDLAEWLTKFRCLPVNVGCAREWLRNKEHLKVCQCLEKEAKELVELFASSLQEYREKLKECKCEVSDKPRTPYYDWKNYGYTYCEKCETTIKGAGKTGVIKNRNDPRFWDLKVNEKVLCLKCLEKFREKMPTRKKYLLGEYLKRGYG